MIEYRAAVKAVLLADDPSTFVTRRVDRIPVELGGIPGDRHFGLLRPADARQHIYPRGQMIANRRQLSVVSVEDCRRIAQNLGIAEVLPEWLGANLLVEGFPEWTLLPQGSRLLFPGGTGLICEGENLPCRGPGKVIGSVLGDPRLGEKFVPAAKRLRGIVCSVEKEGFICEGDEMKVIRLA